jgi:DNA-binding NarL/FixJ family response regulator
MADAAGISVMAVDDHPIFLQGLSCVLAKEPGLRLVRVHSGEEALTASACSA